MLRNAIVRLGVSFLATSLSLAAKPGVGQPQPSDLCGDCHRDIYKMWRASAHAKSMEDPVFLIALRETEAREGKTVSQVCISCHAPTVAITKDFELKQKLSWEGVGCDVCHSIVAVDTKGPAPKLVYKMGSAKRGPIRDAASMAHEVEYSELHTQSIVCAPCHEFANAEGTPLMTTFTEWKSSEAAKTGKTCQLCHMARTRADVVDPKVKRVPDSHVNVHQVPGGHSIEQLHKALEVTLHPKREGDALLLQVSLRNKGAGHAVPTGMPGRRVILDVRVRTNQGGERDERKIYGRSFVGATGAPITRDSAFFARGVREVSDTRIKPDEKRVEAFRFPVPTSATAYATVKLHYEHAPSGTDENRTWITFFSEERMIVPEKR